MSNIKQLPRRAVIGTFLFALSCLSVFAQISLSVERKPMREVIKEIEKISDYRFFYNDEIQGLNTLVTLEVKEKPIQTVMNEIVRQTGISYVLKDNNQIVLSTPRAHSRPSSPKRISGVVTDPKGEPIIGANVVEKGTANGTITDLDGRFVLEISASATLQISYIGYNTKELAAGNRNELAIQLSEDAQNLDEVVVVGYGTVRKKDVTGSVSTIGQDDFNVGIVTSPTEMMQGRIPGVNITANGGEPGAGTSVRIRGSNSIRSGQEPLYVVDGVPLETNDTQPGGATVDGIGASSTKNPLNFLNPDDIESIDVLKDASATAIYGSRGANGVIIVTTKKGKEGAPKVSYSGYMALSSLPKQLPMLTADEYRQVMNDEHLTFSDMRQNTNWQDEIFRTSLSHNHSLSIGGGGQHTQYRASLSYMNQEGIIRRTGLEKYTGRFTFSQTALRDRLKIDGSLTVARTNDARAPLGESGGNQGDLLLSTLKLNPTYPVYNPDGSFYQTTPDVRNPKAMLYLTDDKTQTDRILMNISASLRIIDGLNYRINIGLDENKASRRVSQNEELIYLSNGGTVDINNVESSSQLIENYLTYDFQVNKIHKFSVMAGTSYQRFNFYTYGLSEYGFNVKDIDYPNDLQYGKYTNATVHSDITKNELQSFFGRVNYNLNEKYLLTVNFRADGSTRFGENNKYGYFPSAALAWRLSEEEFIKKLNLFDNLKLRLGYGITGNQEIPNKISQRMLGSVPGAILDGSASNVTPGITLTRTPNPDIKWEKTAQTNLGLDFAFLGGRLYGSVDYFYKKTKDVLLEIYSISPAPTEKMWMNVPDMRILNQGLEVSLNSRLVDNKDWSWDLGINLATVRNKVQNCPMSQITSGTASGPGLLNQICQVIMNDYPIGTFWGKKFQGFDENGLSIYEKDADGKDKNQVIGDANPDLTFNLNTTLRYKRFDLSLFFNGVFGNDIYNNLGNIINQRSLFPKEWNMTHQGADSPQSFDDLLVVSDRFIENGSYFRLSSATLGYTFDTHKIDWLGHVRLYAAGNNLFTLTSFSGYDPEVNSDHSYSGVPSMGIAWTNYPKARTFTFGVNVEF